MMIREILTALFLVAKVTNSPVTSRIVRYSTAGMVSAGTGGAPWGDSQIFA